MHSMKRFKWLFPSGGQWTDLMVYTAEFGLTLDVQEGQVIFLPTQVWLRKEMPNRHTVLKTERTGGFK